jgi:hypothetical protein
MKKLLIFFGILDLIAFIKSFQLISSLIETGKITHWTNIVLAILFLSLILSGIFQILSKKTGIWIYYCQFPFRLFYSAGFSFGFILLSIDLFPDFKQIFLILSILCMTLECLRLTLTIMIHRKFYLDK